MMRAVLTALFASGGMVLAISSPQIADPLIRFDDYPAFFGDEALYYEKTLAEGRWLNYWWMARETLWPSWLAFLVYQAGWAVFAAGAAVNALGPGARLTNTALLAALIAVSPQAFLISGWFNTLTLGVWIPALFALAALALPIPAARWLFLAAAPVSMLSYSTYPLLMFGLLLTRHDIRRSLSGLFLLVALLGLSVFLGILLIYSMNGYAHGVFGMQLADWRMPAPATDLEGLSANLAALPGFLARLVVSSGFGHPALGALNAALLVVALGLLAAKRRIEAGFIAAGIIVSIGLMVAHAVQSGVEVPVRALVVVWVFFAIALVRTVEVAVPADRRKAATVALIALGAVFAGQLLRNAGYLSEWQAETRALASQVPADTESIMIFGDFSKLPTAERAGILHHQSLSFRLYQLTGQGAVNCGDPLAGCAISPPFGRAPNSPGSAEVVVAGGVAYIRLPE